LYIPNCMKNLILLFRVSSTVCLLLVVLIFESNAQIKYKLPNYTLPKLLVNTDGTKVKTSQDWMAKRRPEILRLFEDNVYGQFPKDFDSIRINVKAGNQKAIEGNPILKEVKISVYRNQQALVIGLTLFIPSNSEKPAPVFLLINHRGKENIDPSREVKTDFWPAEQLIKRGYAIAAFQVSDLAADDKLTYDQGLLKLYPEQLQKANGMKAIGAWAWGASRIMDYLQQDKDIDASKVVVLGHSRGGKAALWCGAQDDRFAITVSNNSGCTGAALSRRKVGETVSVINERFPHWFCAQYKSFNNREEELPIDQHQLIALMAPRAVYVASASEDEWADPEGEFLALKLADPAYKLFGLKPLPSARQPALHVPINTSDRGYHIRSGKHGLTRYDWERYMDFADGYFSSSNPSR
jgi:dienelactone hydrolase